MVSSTVMGRHRFFYLRIFLGTSLVKKNNKLYNLTNDIIERSGHNENYARNIY